MKQYKIKFRREVSFCYFTFIYNIFVPSNLCLFLQLQNILLARKIFGILPAFLHQSDYCIHDMTNEHKSQL